MYPLIKEVVMDAIIKSRIDLDLKTDVERILATLGLTVSDAIRPTFKKIAARQGLPFDVKIPNAQTQSAMRDMPMRGLLRCGQYSAARGCLKLDKSCVWLQPTVDRLPCHAQVQPLCGGDLQQYGFARVWF